MTTAAGGRGGSRRDREAMHLKLYVAARSANSMRAVANLRALFLGRRERPRLDIVDVFASAEEALAAGIIVTPTLVKLSPHPTIRIVGDLSDRLAVMTALGLDPDEVPP